MNTIANRKALRDSLGKSYDHNPDHYQFRRTITGFYPEREPARADYIVCIVAAVIAAVIVPLMWMGVL